MRLKQFFVMQMCKLDTRIMRSVGQLRQLELKFEAGSALDYRWVLVPIVKLYMRVGIELLVLLCHPFHFLGLTIMS